MEQDLPFETKLVFQLHNCNEVTSFPLCRITLDNKMVTVFVDLCSAYTLDDKNLFSQLFPDMQKELEVPDIKPGGYNRDPIPLLVMTTMEIRFEGRNTVGKIYVT